MQIIIHFQQVKYMSVTEMKLYLAD